MQVRTFLSRIRPSPSWSGVLALLCDVAMVQAIVSLFQEDSRRFSAGAATVWIGLELLRLVDQLPWSWGGLAILLLNIRGVVLEEGPTPVSHMDYVLMILAFLVGFGRSERRWLRTSALICGACLIGILLNAEIIWDFAWWSVEYQTNLLTKNQTALLAGIGAQSGVMAALLARRHFRSMIWILMIPGVLGCLILARSTLSRAGLALVPLSLAAAGFLVARPMLMASAGAWLGSLSRRRRHGLIIAILSLGAVLLASLLTFLIHPAGLPARLEQLYGEANLANDLGRLRVWQCYSALPFMGENRFLYGVGYQNSWQKWCTPEAIGRFLTHSHNFLLQIWGDSGVIATIFIVLCLLLILGRILSNATPSCSGQDRSKNLPWAMALASSATVFYLLGFNSFELGMLKVPILTALFGHLLASVFYAFPSGESRR